MRGGAAFTGKALRIGKQGKRAARRHGGIELTQGSRRRISGISEGFLVLRDHCLVERKKIRFGHKDLAADLDFIGCRVGELPRDRGNCQ